MVGRREVSDIISFTIQNHFTIHFMKGLYRVDTLTYIHNECIHTQ